MKISQEWKDAFVHLRLHFSLLLMPVFLFAVSQPDKIYAGNTWLLFLILHFLVYPASNIFNSYYDNDTGSVGGLKNPPPANNKMLWLANILDMLSIIVFYFYINATYFEALLVYIIASRLYSYRPIRLKQYPIIGFIIIFLFQGALIYNLTILAIADTSFMGCVISGIWPRPEVSIFALLAASFQIGAMYPLTQIYQHKSDLEDGVTTLSYKLGYRGTFVFSGIMFGIATLCYYFHFKESDIQSFYLLMIAQVPIVSFFLYWAYQVWNDESQANFKNTMRMNIVAAIVLNLFFLWLIINKY